MDVLVPEAIIYLLMDICGLEYKEVSYANLSHLQWLQTHILSSGS